jgi:hypothetical protein
MVREGEKTKRNMSGSTADLRKELKEQEETGDDSGSDIAYPDGAHTKASEMDSPITDGGDIEKAPTERDLESGQRTPAQRVMTAQDWTGPDDKENPHNWPMWLRIYHTAVPGLFAFVV